ncbi:MAG: SprT family zinc-dependent metalloprotease [Methanimicrococcus sp.]|nr:SprT family zinc-dependent metalloprotease [Methanimicrococcus sp.]
MPPVRPAAGEKTTRTVFSFGPDLKSLDGLIIHSKKRKKSISYTVRYDFTEPEEERQNSNPIKNTGENDFDQFDSGGKKPILFVRAPYSLSVESVQSILSENKENIIELIEKAFLKEEAAQKKSKRTYREGSLFHYMGRTYVLQLFYEKNVDKSSKISVHLLDGQLQVYLPRAFENQPDVENEKRIQKAVDQFYIEQADVFFNSRTDYFAEKYFEKIGKKPKSVKAVFYKSKWGCCTYQNDIKLNWVLIQANTPIIDYVIVHELCHIRHKNHSRDFWNLVEEIDPKYKEKRRELKENGWLLEMK